MNKTLKKAVATLLAVLMVAFSVPFTASAAVGDYQPNINLQFSTIGNFMSNYALVGDGAYDISTNKDQSYSTVAMYTGP